MYTRQMTHGSGAAANPETVQGMLDGLGQFLDFIAYDYLPSTNQASAP